MKILIVGYGSIGRRHLSSFQRVRPGYQYALLRRAAKAGEQYPAGVQVFDDINEAHKYSADLTCICTPSQNHHLDLEQLLPSIQNIFLEKPVATNLEALDLSANLIKKIKGKFFYGCVMRFHPALVALKEIAEKQEFGRPLAYQIHCGSYLPDWRPNQDYSSLYSARAESGGVVLDLIHEFDYAQWCFGTIEKLIGLKAKTSSLKIDSYDSCSASLRHADGILGNISLNYFQRKSVRSCSLIMENGQADLDLLSGRIIVSDQSGKQTARDYLISRDQQFDLQAEAMISCLESGLDSCWDLDSAIELNRKIISI